MMKRDAGIRWTTKKNVVSVLLVLSFLMLFLPWMSISINAMGQKFTIPKMLDYLSIYNGYSATEFRAELYRSEERRVGKECIARGAAAE